MGLDDQNLKPTLWDIFRREMRRFYARHYHEIFINFFLFMVGMYALILVYGLAATFGFLD